MSNEDILKKHSFYKEVPSLFPVDPDVSYLLVDAEGRLVRDPFRNSTIPVRFKKLHPDAVTPKYAKPGDAAMDLVAISKEYDADLSLIVMGTGLALEIPENYVGLIFPRSSICKTPLMLSNHVGVIDSGYRGEIKFAFRHLDRPRKNYEIGDRIGQLIILPYPKIELEEVSELSDSERGTGGYGSTGK